MIGNSNPSFDLIHDCLVTVHIDTVTWSLDEASQSAEWMYTSFPLCVRKCWPYRKYTVSVGAETRVIRATNFYTSSIGRRSPHYQGYDRSRVERLIGKSDSQVFALAYRP